MNINNLQQNIRLLNKKLEDNLVNIRNIPMETEEKEYYNNYVNFLNTYLINLNKISIKTSKDEINTILLEFTNNKDYIISTNNKIDDLRNELCEKFLEQISDITDDFFCLNHLCSSSKGNAITKIQLQIMNDKIMYVLYQYIYENFEQLDLIECLMTQLEEIIGRVSVILFKKERDYSLDKIHEDLVSVNKKIELSRKQNYQKLIKIAKENGYNVKRFNGSHAILENENGKNTVVPHKSNHKQFGKGLTSKILKEII